MAICEFDESKLLFVFTFYFLGEFIMKKVMLIGALMVLSGLPNIYASEPMESEDMGMESRDFPTITSVQRVIEGNNQETQKILPFEDEIKKCFCGK